MCVVEHLNCNRGLRHSFQGHWQCSYGKSPRFCINNLNIVVGDIITARGLKFLYNSPKTVVHHNTGKTKIFTKILTMVSSHKTVVVVSITQFNRTTPQTFAYVNYKNHEVLLNNLPCRIDIWHDKQLHAPCSYNWLECRVTDHLP